MSSGHSFRSHHYQPKEELKIDLNFRESGAGKEQHTKDAS